MAGAAWPAYLHTIVRVEMQLSNFEKRRIEIWEQMRRIEGELFLLSARSGELDSENGHRFKRLCGERATLANELQLHEHR